MTESMRILEEVTELSGKKAALGELLALLNTNATSAIEM